VGERDDRAAQPHRRDLINLDWARLIVHGERRTALFAEDFPARLDAVIHQAPALQDSFDEVTALELSNCVAQVGVVVGRCVGGSDEVMICRLVTWSPEPAGS
jgi:hypothetical protein